MGAIIMDFGRNNDGLFLYRINGEKKEIEKYISDLKELGCEIYEPIDLEKTWKQHSVLLKIKFPSDIEEEMEKKRIADDENRARTNAIRERMRSKKEC